MKTRLTMLALFYLPLSCKTASSDLSEKRPVEVQGEEILKDYIPGNSLTYEKYEKMLEAMQLWNEKPPTPGAYEDYFSAVDKEAIGALYKIFTGYSDGSTDVWFGTYGPSEDQANGLRLISKRTIEDTKGVKHLIYVITFWQVKDGTFKLIGGTDALRVRINLGPSDRDYLGVSYTADVDKQGKVTKLYPSDWRNMPESGRQMALIPRDGSKGCLFCHHGNDVRSNFPLRPGKYPIDFDKWNGRESVIKEHLGEKYNGRDFVYETGAKSALYSDMDLKGLAKYDLTEKIVDQNFSNGPLRPDLMEIIHKTPSKNQRDIISALRDPKKYFLPNGLLDVIRQKANAKK